MLPRLNKCQIEIRSFREDNRWLYGIYIIRCRSSGEVLYIGKCGTVDSKGHFPKTIHLVRRLQSGRTRAETAEAWFRDIVKEQGSIDVEYIVLGLQDKTSTNLENSPRSLEQTYLPTFVEAALLQTYFNNKKHLPIYNEAF
jgi:hypothetical protein